MSDYTTPPADLPEVCGVRHERYDTTCAKPSGHDGPHANQAGDLIWIVPAPEPATDPFQLAVKAGLFHHTPDGRFVVDLPDATAPDPHAEHAVITDRLSYAVHEAEAWQERAQHAEADRDQARRTLAAVNRDLVNACLTRDHYRADLADVRTELSQELAAGRDRHRVAATLADTLRAALGESERLLASARSTVTRRTAERDEARDVAKGLSTHIAMVDEARDTAVTALADVRQRLNPPTEDPAGGCGGTCYADGYQQAATDVADAIATHFADSVRLDRGIAQCERIARYHARQEDPGNRLPRPSHDTTPPPEGDRTPPAPNRSQEATQAISCTGCGDDIWPGEQVATGGMCAICAVADRTAERHAWEPAYGFLQTDPIPLAHALEAVRRRICAYGAHATTCDCKFGLTTFDVPANHPSGERTGCPELRSTIHLLLHPETGADAREERAWHRGRDAGRRIAATVIERHAATLGEDARDLMRRAAELARGRAGQTEPDSVEQLLDTAHAGLATATDDQERAEILAELLDGWYQAWPDSAVTDPHAPIAAEIVRLLAPAALYRLRDAARAVARWGGTDDQATLIAAVRALDDDQADAVAPVPAAAVIDTYHWGRSWSPSNTEATCPCPKAPCGYVIRGSESDGCDEHDGSRTMRGGHTAERCPERTRAEVCAPECAPPGPDTPDAQNRAQNAHKTAEPDQ